MSMEAEHVVFTTDGAMKCLHCGTEEAVKFPISVNDLASQAYDFTKIHFDCEVENEQAL